MKIKSFLLVFLFATFSIKAFSQHLVEVWRTGPQLKTPESVPYSPEKQIIFVANINGNPADKDGNGFISQLNSDGTMKTRHWIDNLNAPKGMAIYEGKLFVSDIEQLVEIDIEKAKIVKRYPVPKAIFLNDVAADVNGTIFVSDSEAGKIYILKDGELKVWLEGNDFRQTNGLFTENGKLYAGSEVLKEIDFTTKTIRVIQTNCQGIDGLSKDELGNFVFSNWDGRIFYLQNDHLNKVWDSTADNINTADIFYAKNLKLLLVPTFFNNQVVAYRIEH